MFCTAAVYPPFPAVVTALLCSQWAWWNKIFQLEHVLRSVVWSIHSLISLFNMAVCAQMVIPFDTRTVSAIFFSPARARVNYLPFSIYLINRSRVSTGL